MQPKYRLYQRSNRAGGTFYAEDCVTRARTTLGTKDRAEAEKLIQAKNEAHAQPTLSRELAKVYMHAQDSQFGQRTWTDVAGLIDAAYEGSTKDRFEKFIKSAPVRGLMNRRLAETCSTDFLTVFAHPKAGVSTNVQLRILHNRALDLEWILRPVLSRKAWPKIKYGFRRGITLAEHQAVLAVTSNKEYRLYLSFAGRQEAARRTLPIFAWRTSTGRPGGCTTPVKSSKHADKVTHALLSARRWSRF